MSQRDRRSSTKEATERQNQKSQEDLEILELKRRSGKLKSYIREEESVILEESKELAKFAVKARIGEAEPEESFDTNSSAIVSEENVEEIESDEEFVDPLKAVRTPSKTRRSSLDFVPLEGQEGDPDNQSTCNLFFPLNCILSPHFEIQPRSLLSTSSILSPVLSLERVLEVEEEVFDTNLEEELPVPNPRNILPIEYFPSAMDEGDYKTKLTVLNKEVRKVKRLIDEYTPAAASIGDANLYHTFLGDIRKAHMKCQDNLDGLLDELEVGNPSDVIRINELKSISTELSNAFKKNDKDVKDKFVQLVAEYETNRPMSVAEKSNLEALEQKEARIRDKEKREAEVRKEKMELKMKSAINKFKELNSTVSKIKATREMSEQEIREYLLESKKWEKKIEDFTGVKETIDQDSVGMSFDIDLKQEVDVEFGEVTDLIANKVAHLALKDKELGLHTLTPNKIKENIVYPPAFYGNPGENVYKFVKDFKTAIEADQVRKSDEIKTLRKHLKGEARTVVGEYHADLTSALESLAESFGSSILILDKLKKDFKKKFGNIRDWGRYGSQQRSTAILQTLDFIKQFQSLAKNHKRELNNEVYNRDTVKAILAGMPVNLTTELNKVVRACDPSEEWILAIADMLETQKQYNDSAATSGIGGQSDSMSFDRERSPESGSPTRRKKSFSTKHGDHDCKSSKACNEDWDLLGCINLYKLESVSKRKTFLKDRKSCWNCGAKFVPKEIHKCNWSDGKYEARCTGMLGSSRCRKGAAMCKEHPNNASSELKTWLAGNKLKFTVSMMMVGGNVQVNPDGDMAEPASEGLLKDFASFTKGTGINIDDQIEAFSNQKLGKSPSISKSKPASRDKLQSGEAAKMMSNDEVANMFTNDMKMISKEASVHPIPKGEPVFIFCIFKGKNGPVQAFIDSGANCWLALDGIPQNELVSAKMNDGPIELGVASGMTVYAKAEWASLLPLADGTHQCVRGLTLEKVTGDMPKLNLVPAFENIKAKCKQANRIHNLKVPRVVGGEVQMIIGIPYQNIFPKAIYSLPNGLTVFESKLLPTAPGVLACIGGPVEALEHICGIAGKKSTITYMASLVQNVKNFRPRVDFFPATAHKNNTFQIDDDIPGIKDLLNCDDTCSEDEDSFDKHDNNFVSSKPFFDVDEEIGNNDDVYLEPVFRSNHAEIIDIETSSDEEAKSQEKDSEGRNINRKDISEEHLKKKEGIDGECKPNNEIDDKHLRTNLDPEVECVVKCSDCESKFHLIQGEMEKFMKLQDAGLDTSYRCPSCRRCKDCLKGAGKERLSMHQEFEQHIIKGSVKIDQEINRAVASLAFTDDPDKHLKNNRHIAVKRLENVCRKYGGKPEIKEMILKGFQKLINKGHIIPWASLTEEEKKSIESSESQYTIPWDVGFKETSLSTPARPTFDASSKSPGGVSLNDILAKGNADIVNMIEMVLNWVIGAFAVIGDISQFYNTILLALEHWKYQQVVWYENLDPTNPLVRGVVATCIYGVTCVGAQTEAVMNILADQVEEESPEVSDFLRKYRYVDDFGKSNKSQMESFDLIKKTEKILATINMFVKGWVMSGEAPPADLSEDGISVGFAGMTWFPAPIDSFKLNIQALHFGKKKRGAYPPDMQRYSGKFGQTVDEFTPKNLTRRMCTSVAARIYDNPGKLAPLTLRLKYDLRKLIKFDPGWDTPIPTHLRARWIENFKLIEDVRDILYVRCPIPSDALRHTVRLWLLCDGADGGMIISAYSGNERPDGTWSCNQLFSKGLLAPAGWSTPQLELHALSTMANIAAILHNALETWIEYVVACSDSEIALSWVIYEKVKLLVFHRLRVSNIRNKIAMGDLFHIDGKENVADIGTRPDNLTAQQLRPGSEWLDGKEWMTRTVNKAVESGILKSTKDIKLDNDSKKVFKEGVIYDSFENVNNVEESNVKKSFDIKANDAEEDRKMSQGYKYIFKSVKKLSTYELTKLKERLADGSQVRRLSFVFRSPNNSPSMSDLNSMLEKYSRAIIEQETDQEAADKVKENEAESQAKRNPVYEDSDEHYRRIHKASNHYLAFSEEQGDPKPHNIHINYAATCYDANCKSFDINNKVSAVNCEKVIERENFSNYLFPPLKRSFRPFIRIIALVLTACKKFKKGMLIAKKKKNGQVGEAELRNINFPPVKFIVFPMILGENVEQKVEKISEKNGKLTDIFSHKVGMKNESRFVKLTDEALSASLEYVFRKATLEVLKFHDKKAVDKIGEMKDGILYCKTRLIEGQTLRAVGGLENRLDLQSFTGVNFQVPLIDRNSPVAISISIHLHYNVVTHKGAETIYRLSLQYARILQGRILFKDISADCIFCKKNSLKYLKQIMGPLSDYQLSISPIFYYTYVDAWGPIKAYVPGYEKETRASTKSFEVQMIVFGCAATGTINCQIMEGGKDVNCILDVFNRFFAEACVPKICFPDKDKAILQALSEGEVDIFGQDGILARVRGISFQTCPAQGHSAHGRIERKIRSIQDCLDKSGMQKMRLPSLGWQTVAKQVEHEVNSVPLGYLQHQTDTGQLLRILSPNSLKLNTSSERAPAGIFSIPNKSGKLMERIEDAYSLFYKIWNVEYLPLIAQRQKWHFEEESLKLDDIVYFKLTESVISSNWLIGKVEFIVQSRDGVVREVGVSYRHYSEDGEKQFSVVPRPVRQVVKLMHIDDTSLLDDIAAVHEEAKKILDSQKIISEEEIERLSIDIKKKPKELETKSNSEEDAKSEEDSTNYEEISKNEENVDGSKTKKRSKRKTEIEKLVIDDWTGPKNAKRNQTTHLDPILNKILFPSLDHTATDYEVLCLDSVCLDKVTDTRAGPDMGERGARVDRREIAEGFG